jgi:uncharacterized protein YndB with AHSA1/START domain
MTDTAANRELVLPRTFEAPAAEVCKCWTGAFTSAWKPSAKPVFVGEIHFEEENGNTKYTAIARHWTKEGMKTHEQMGFREGWGHCADQLAELQKTI